MVFSKTIDLYLDSRPGFHGLSAAIPRICSGLPSRFDLCATV
jgi:hypothetical protein